MESHVFASLSATSRILAGLLMLALFIVPTVFYLLTLRRALILAGREHRRLEPGLVWLMLVPLFGLAWHFVLVRRVADAVQRWAKAHGQEVGDGGWGVGLAACILCCCAVLPVLGILGSVGGLVCTVLWWVKVANFNRLMQG